MRSRLEVRLLKAEVLEALLFEYVTWSSKQLTTTGYGRSITRCSFDASACGNGNAKTAFCPTLTHLSRQIPRALRRRCADEGYSSRLFVARMEEEHLPRRVMLGKMIEGEGYSFGQEKDWMGRVEEDLKEIGIKSKGGARQH